MAQKTAETTEMVQARVAMVVVAGARPIVYQRRIVRNRHTGRLEEIDIHELDPVDPGDDGVGYAFKAGEQMPADHPAVLASPGGFRPVAN